jgi:O-antigen/teichoic acid export membrane protein
MAAPVAVLGLPGSFGRYVETYRSQGQLRTFLRRTLLGSVAPAVLCCVALFCFAQPAAEALFGDAAQAGLMQTTAVALVGFIAFNFCTCLFTGLRANRVVSYLQFANTLVFAALGIALLNQGPAEASDAVAAFGAACFLSVGVSLVWLVRMWRALPSAEPPLAHAALWSRLVPFAFWVWITNWLTNLFEIADRYMIVHCAGLPQHEAMELVGQYHSARVMPMLFLGLADLLATLITPHLTGDWEAGRRDVVARRLTFILKLFALVFLGGAIALLIASPLFFHTALADKFGFGQAIFPWTLACALWTGMAMISQNWLWCAEKSRWVCVGLAVGLATNVGLNFVLLPQWGLEGAVLSSAVAKLTALGILWLVCRAMRMPLERGLLIVALLPGALLLGPWTALSLAMIAAAGWIRPLAVFNADERRELWTAAERLLAKLPLVRRRAPTAA